jgi:hypothetical protein
MTLFSKVTNKPLKIVLPLIFLLTSFLILNCQIRVFKFWFSSKIWAHRVNSIDKFQEAQNYFSGVELDIVFDSLNNSFDVNHPPAKSINLTLSDFLKSKKEYDHFGIWLDFKNLNVSNYLQSLNRLDSITSMLNINAVDIIVESKDPAFLSVFSEKGFKTSYYLPSNISNLKNEELVIQVDFINNLIDSVKINYISSDVKDYTFMKEKFPNAKIITWIISDIPKIKSLSTLKGSISNFKRNFNVLSDQNVEVVLFTFNAKSGNR